MSDVPPRATKPPETAAQRIAGIAERERRLIATEIHDTLGAETTTLRLTLVRLQKLLTKTNAAESPEVIQTLSWAIKLVESIYETQRAITTKLRPESLDVLGLPAAIEQLIHENSQLNRSCVYRFVCQERNVPLDDLANIAFYRVAQEALLNVLKHAHASECLVEITSESDAISLAISDNGVGFVSAKVTRGFGIEGMRERIATLGGSFNVEPIAPSGTQVMAKLWPHL
jgi:signal transduction histidine kinase